jgi:hypothetical protein
VCTVVCTAVCTIVRTPMCVQQLLQQQPATVTLESTRQGTVLTTAAAPEYVSSAVHMANTTAARCDDSRALQKFMRKMEIVVNGRCPPVADDFSQPLAASWNGQPSSTYGSSILPDPFGSSGHRRTVSGSNSFDIAHGKSK